MMDLEIDDLVCPVCRHPLQWGAEPNALKCSQCRRVYPIRDGIPVLLESEAVIAEE